MDGFFGAAIAMNCQKSSFHNIMACTKGRTLQYYEGLSECEKSVAALRKDFGVYSLATDPDNSQ